MGKLLQFTPREVNPLWSPKPGCSASWRMRAEQGQLLRGYFDIALAFKQSKTRQKKLDLLLAELTRDKEIHSEKLRYQRDRLRSFQEASRPKDGRGISDR